MQVWVNLYVANNKFEVSLQTQENSAVGQESLSDRSRVTSLEPGIYSLYNNYIRISEQSSASSFTYLKLSSITGHMIEVCSKVYSSTPSFALPHFRCSACEVLAVNCRFSSVRRTKLYSIFLCSETKLIYDG